MGYLSNVITGKLPKKQLVLLYGPEGCISGESYLQYETWTKDNSRLISKKGGSIRRLWERFTGNITGLGPKQGGHLQNNDVNFYVKSVCNNDRVVRNKVLDVISTGNKECFRVETANGQVLYSTLDHKYLTATGYHPLETLSVGDNVFIHNNTRVTGKKIPMSRSEVYVKYHPNLSTRVIKDKDTGKGYIYYRGVKSRLAYEAYLNDLTFVNYINKLNTCSKSEIEALTFLDSSVQIHHIDENFLNNDIKNLEPIDIASHAALHANDKIMNLSFVVIPSEIVRINSVGYMDTYDIKCAYPLNNYIAEGIVVHNCGKSTFGANAHNPIFLCTENGTENLNVARLPAPTSWDDIHNMLWELHGEAHDYKTLVIDTLDWLEPILFEYLTKDKKPIEEVGGGYGKWVGVVNNEWRKFMNVLDILRKRLDIIILAHAQIKTFNDPINNTPYDRYELKLHSQKSSWLWKEYVDCLLFANFEVMTKVTDAGKAKAYGTGERKMFTEHRPAFDAKNRDNLPFELPLNYNDYISYMDNDLAKIKDDIAGWLATLSEKDQAMHLEQLRKISTNVIALNVYYDRSI